MRANKIENEKWRVEYENDTGPNDDSFCEWWNVTDGESLFRAKTQERADWLCRVLNEHSKPKPEKYVEMEGPEREQPTKEQLESIMWEPTLQRMRRIE